MKEKALILFFKYPEEGAVKTRIAKDLGEAFTLELYRRFIDDMIQTGKKIDGDIFIVYSLADEANDSNNYLWQKQYRCLRQKGEDMGDRMHNAFQEFASQGYGKLALIGSDAPDLPAEYIEEAFFRLDANDVVLGPSADGGYYLIALRDDTINRVIFDGVPWSTPRVLDETLRIVRRKNITCHLLPEWYDIDEVDDLRYFYDRNKKSGEALRTLRFLSRNKAGWQAKF